MAATTNNTTEAQMHAADIKFKQQHGGYYADSIKARQDAARDRALDRGETQQFHNAQLDETKRFHDQTIAQGIFTAADLEAIEAGNRSRIDEAIAFAEQSPLPDPSELLTDVYVTE